MSGASACAREADVYQSYGFEKIIFVQCHQCVVRTCRGTDAFASDSFRCISLISPYGYACGDFSRQQQDKKDCSYMQQFKRTCYIHPGEKQSAEKSNPEGCTLKQQQICGYITDVNVRALQLWTGTGPGHGFFVSRMRHDILELCALLLAKLGFHCADSILYNFALLCGTNEFLARYYDGKLLSVDILAGFVFLFLFIPVNADLFGL